LAPDQTLPPEGSYYVGGKGVLLIHGAGGGRSQGRGPLDGLLPASRFADYTPPPKTIPRTIGHYKEWIEACKGGPAANCNFEFANLLNETALLGVVSARTGKHLIWDSRNMRFTNAPESSEYIQPAYRSGWSV
jgi:hypothetical protein